MGIRSKLASKPRLILGQSRVNLLEMTGAYGVFANRGLANRPHIIDRIIDISHPGCSYKNYQNNAECIVLYSYNGDADSGLKPDIEQNREVLFSGVADNMTYLLQAVVSDGKNGGVRGTASNVKIENAVGKTGTSDKSGDLWFID